ncbi:MAG: ComEC/Rec2 family competence protein [Beijerinckiaceae bacterium]|jgi:competence protein ComEC
MSDTAGRSLTGRALAGGASAASGGLSGRWRLAFGLLWGRFARAFESEVEHRRLFLWFPVALGTGDIFYFVADREPPLWLCAGLCLGFAVLAYAARAHRKAFCLFVAVAACAGGMVSAGWRSARVAAPVLDRIRILDVEGYIEEMDFRREGARFILRVAAADGLDPEKTPYRIRLTTRRAPPFEAGTYVQVKARLLPPSRAAQPGGYDFARDAWFARIGAVGNVLGQIELAQAPDPPDLMLSATMAIDRARNALARRVDTIIGGDTGAIAAAMVTGKRDLLSDDAKNLIREAGIFHVITISGVQMTLVAGIFFIGLRRLLALSRTLALRYPIKKWAAAAAILAAVVYDIATGSRIGTERALFMTVIMLSAVLMDRHALSMRNLALAALLVLLFEPEALLGASFQLSFAAVGALVAVYEARAAAFEGGPADRVVPENKRGGWFTHWLGTHFGPGKGLGPVLFATFCATSAMASFMAYDFHEMNPYVLIGNPLTLIIIEIFAVPGALLGTLLYPFGLDAFVWHYVGAGISIIMAAARLVGSLPGASLHLPAFAPWSLAFLSLAVLSAVLWRSALLRATAIPFALAGLAGAAAGMPFDIAVAPLGDAAAVRLGDGRLAVLGERPSAFAAEQWLRADADGRAVKTAIQHASCDKTGCTGILRDGRAVALVLEKPAFAEDCLRAAVLITPLFAPRGCAAGLIIDRDTLRRTGAVTLRAKEGGFEMRTARAEGEDRPWSPAPPARWGAAAKDDPEAGEDVSSVE